MVSTLGAKKPSLIESYARTGSTYAREQLVSDYTPLVRSLCRRFLSSRESQEDLFQIGVFGLLNAIDKFDPDRGTSFSSLATPEVLGAISNYLRDHGSLLKVPQGLRRNKLAIDRASDSLATTLGRWPTVTEVAGACELSEKQVNEAAELGRVGDPYSLDQSLDSDDADNGVTLCELLGSEDVEFDLSLDRLTLAGALDTLPQREKSILHLWFYIGMSQRQIAELIQISQMHVSRLERSALKKLRLVLRRNPATTGRLGSSPASYGPPLPAAS